MKVSVYSAAVLCAVLSAGCSVDANGPSAGNTEVNLDIMNPDGTSGELGFSIDRVDYRITCAGNPGAPIPDADTTGAAYAYDDSVDISGAFEIIDTRVPPVWQAVMDLPPGDCTITLSVYEDDEVVCVGSQTLVILEDGTTKYDIVLVCSLSIDLPDGMADVDGTFEFITGNACPKLYVLNAVPSVTVLDVTTPILQTEIQYRAKDPDNTCGANCDPQSCTGDNPPVCTPYPSNINDPACNPAAGGDPNSPECLAGDHAGLVCTLTASDYYGPSGAFLSPTDGVTPVGPVLPVNLNTLAGVPGVILPGLGGPSGTNAANSPAYPPLPNANGALPPLYFQFDNITAGPVTMTLHCSDGDAECDQTKVIEVDGYIPHWCLGDPIDCSASGECLTDGFCDNFCSPFDDCDRCPGKDDPAPDGTACSLGSCLSGTCVECVANADCATAPSPPIDCQLPNNCIATTCQAGGIAPSGTPCSNGLCDGTGIGPSACQFVLIDPPPQTATLTMGCTNNITADVSIVPFQLDVDPDPILTGATVPVTLGGVAEFPEFFLDAAQELFVGGITSVDLVTLAATALIRTGGTLPANTTLTNSPIPGTCLLGGVPCDPINNLPSVPGSLPNTDCVPTSTFNTCQQLIVVPTSPDCSVGGTCDLLGKKASQCDVNGFCVTGSLPLPLATQSTTFQAAASGVVTFGYDDVNTDATPLNPDGTYNLPGAGFGGPPRPNEIELKAGGAAVAMRCTMAVDSGGPDGVGVPDQASPTPSANLPTFNIQVP